MLTTLSTIPNKGKFFATLPEEHFGKPSTWKSFIEICANTLTPEQISGILGKISVFLPEERTNEQKFNISKLGNILPVYKDLSEDGKKSLWEIADLFSQQDAPRGTQAILKIIEKISISEDDLII